MWRALRVGEQDANVGILPVPNNDRNKIRIQIQGKALKKMIVLLMVIMMVF